MMKWALCMPSSCSQKDVVEVTQVYLPQFIEIIWGPSFNVTVAEEPTVCKVKDSW